MIIAEIVGAALRGRPIGRNNMVESDRVATKGHPYSCLWTGSFQADRLKRIFLSLHI